EAAKRELEREEKNINEMLGGMDGVEYVGPRAPRLPVTERSMAPAEFTLAALRMLGAGVAQQAPDLYLVEQNGGRELIRFTNSPELAQKSTLYAPAGTPQ